MLTHEEHAGYQSAFEFDTWKLKARIGNMVRYINRVPSMMHRAGMRDQLAEELSRLAERIRVGDV